MIDEVKIMLQKYLLLTLIAVLMNLFFAVSGFTQTNGLVFTVNDIADTADASVGDGICADAIGRCTLRAAIEESNATIARDAIIFNLPQPSTINLTLGELAINYSLYIVGPGARRLTVQRSTNAGTPDFRVFNIPSGRSVVDIRNVTIRNGNGASGGAIFVGAETIVRLYDSALIGNHAVEGQKSARTRIAKRRVT